MVKKKTHEEFIKDVYNLVGKEYEVIGKYNNSKTKIKIKHNECGYEYNVQAGSFLRGVCCPKCSGRMKKTTEQYKKEVFDLVGNEYDVIGEYINSQKKIKMKHNDCGYEYEVVPSSFLEGRRCRQCKYKKLKKSQTMTNKQFDEKLFNVTKGNIIRIDDYINSQTKIKFFHDIEECGHVWKSVPSSILSGTGCPKCSGLMKKTTKMFKNEVYKLVKDEYAVLSEYTNSNTKIEIKHNICGYEYNVLPSNFLSGQKCPKCSGKVPKNTEVFKNKVFDLVGDEYEVLGKYIDSRTKVKVRHRLCEHIYNVKPNVFLKGCRCPKCAGLTKKTTEGFRREVYNIVGNEYIVLGEYINSQKKIKMKHKKCNKEYEVVPSSFLRGTRCPKCTSSKGEKRVSDLLDRFNCSYERQYSHSNCRHKKPLPFDFAIFNPDKTINCLVEYDGVQHFKPVEHFGGEEGFKQRQRNDQIKNDYCKKNRIPLIRISYKQFDNIETILEKELTVLGVVREESIESILV